MEIQKPFKDFFYFSRGERRGIVVLTAGIILVFLSGYIYLHWKERRQPSETEIQQQAAAIAEYETFLASIQEKERKDKYPEYRRERPTPAVLDIFNPNTADSSDFRRMGLPGWMARNILRYRNKGGKFRKAEDFRKIYGMTEEQYQTLLPYIYIAPEDAEVKRPHLYHSPAENDSTSTPRIIQEKYQAGIVIDLNRADTAELKKIPGIGSGIARLITGYRQRLGGFYNIGQLQEIKLDVHRLQPWFSIDAKAIRLINLNRAGIEKLRNHPYINFYQAKAFVEYRKKQGSFHSLKPFALYEEFTDADLERISHYVCFE